MSDDGRVDLADFLLARLAEDEAVARAAEEGPWRIGGSGIISGLQYVAKGIRTDGTAEHIARWDPARVLAKCEAKRRIVKIAQDSVKHRDEMRALMKRLGQEPGDAMHSYEGWTDGLMRSLVYLAAPYADHPDYDESWRP